MRFLNTNTLHFEEVADSELHLDKNQYAILSHRWGPDEDEVSYQDMTSSSLADASQKKGFAKIKGFCDLASSSGCRYGWVDTCCINKGNSSELAEAINSMYLWYSHSKTCVVYLEDVPRRQLTDSEWFDRGWTLQELIAPKTVLFFDHDWKLVGTKTELLAELSRKTRIPEGVLSHTIKPSACSIAQRMSWAAKRMTKRAEDRAYSLLGLFDVNMPMIYGEREKAFVRLQQHIVQKSKDESIFAWDMGPPDSTMTAYSGIYAPSPSAFIDCAGIIQVSGSNGFSESNGELSIRLLVSRHSPGIFLALLHCKEKAVPGKGIYMVIARTSGEDTYVRVRDVKNISRGLTDLNLRLGEWELRFPVDAKDPPVKIFYGFWLRTLQPPGWAESEITILSNCRTDEADHICQLDRKQENTGIVLFKPRNDSELHEWSQISWIKFGFDKDFNPVLWLANNSQSPRLRDPFERAVLSRNSDSRTQAENEIMEGDIESDLVCGDDYRHFLCHDLQYDWPHGRAIVEVDRKTGLPDFVIHKLDVQISVQLQPRCRPTMRFSGGIDESGSPQNPMMIWVVDITSTTGTPEPTPEELDVDWYGWLCTLIYCPCARCCCMEEDCDVCFCRCLEEDDTGPNCFDCFYPCCKAKWARVEGEERQAEY
jgi:Heterokaryon incompatibility protein (HET)